MTPLFLRYSLAISVLLLVAAAPCPTLPTTLTYKNAKLPDPFTFYDGQKILTKSDWECRRQEIFELLQRTEYGTLPPKPSSVTGSLEGNTLTVNVSHEGKSISFTARVDIPSNKQPVPALIALGGLSLPPLPGVATVIYNNDDIASQASSGSRGQGKFFDMYGRSHSAGAFVAWAWGASRIIDVLETLPDAPIDVKRIALTGCSRNAKGTLAIGAFESRIALTLPQESGSGGTGCWRITDSLPRTGIILPNSSQTAWQLVKDTVWFSILFNQYAPKVAELPTDHHLLAALIAPRALLVLEHSGMDWLVPKSTWGCMKAARKVFDALGVADRMGISYAGAHNHCQFPASQSADLFAFVDKFLFDRETDTEIVKPDNSTQFGYSEYQWVDWLSPTLT